jgi:hypothetical protein
MIPRLPLHARIAFACAALVLGVATASAQPVIDKNRSSDTPDQQFGIGINNAGLHIQYAMGPALHLGLNLNLDVDKRDNIKPDIYHFGPYAKFLFASGMIKPYAIAAVGVLKPGTGKFGLQGRRGMADSFYVYLPDPELSVKVAGGGEYFFSQNVGLYGHVNLLYAVVSAPTSIDVGLLGAVFGIEFFF